MLDKQVDPFTNLDRHLEAPLTPWPANISWALIANRSSCFAGRELALALAPLSADTREAINAQFVRVFAGEGTAQDVDDMAKKYGCDVVVVVPQDKEEQSRPNVDGCAPRRRCLVDSVRGSTLSSPSASFRSPPGCARNPSVRCRRSGYSVPTVGKRFASSGPDVGRRGESRTAPCED